MGLLDRFTNMSPDQSQGLLSAASQILQASGDPRRPFGFGQAAGLGIQEYQEHTERAKRLKQQEEEAAQLQEMRQMQMGGLRQEQEAAQAKIQRMAGVEALTRDYFSGGGRQDPAMAAIAKMQGPTMANAQELEQVQAQAPQQGQQPDRYQQLLGLADHLRKGGFSQEADAAMKQALEFQPKVKNWQEVRQGDQVLYAPFFEDGTAGQPVPLEVARKLERVDSGQSNDMIDPYTGQIKASIGKKQTLESLASNAVTMRGQNMTDSRARDFNAVQVDANNLKREERKAVQDMTKAGQVASFDTMLGTLDRLGSHPGLKRSVGLVGKFPTMPGSESANFQAELDTFQSQAFIPMVSQLKGMGALSDAEGKKLTAAVGALNPNMGETAFRQSVQRITDEMVQARARVSGQPARPASAPAQQPVRKSVLKGQVIDGYRFKGGDPSQQSNWEKT